MIPRRLKSNSKEHICCVIIMVIIVIIMFISSNMALDHSLFLLTYECSSCGLIIAENVVISVFCIMFM